MPDDPFVREKFTKERSAARKAIREYFKRFPKERYQTEVESWRHLQSQNFEFTMKRLREPIERATEIAKSCSNAVARLVRFMPVSFPGGPAIRRVFASKEAAQRGHYSLATPYPNPTATLYKSAKTLEVALVGQESARPYA